VKQLAVIALVLGALVVSATSSTAGAVPARQAATTFNCVSACTDYATTINQFFTDVAADSGLATNVFSTLPQYSTQSAPIAYSTTFDSTANTYETGDAYPAAACKDGFDKYCVTDKQMQAEIAKVIATNGWPTQTQTALYFIFTPANVGVCMTAGRALDGVPCTTNAFCAYHRNSGNKFLYAVEPDDAAVYESGCTPFGAPSPAGNDTDPTLSTISHEMSEAITDPYGTGWYSEDSESFMGVNNAFYGSENGDLCAWNFGDSLGLTVDGQDYNQVINGHDYWLQQEYSNADGGCVQYTGGTVTNFGPSDFIYDGVGPLVNHNGPTMPSTTVYAIYWIPAKPVETKLPAIVGTARVGNKLRALHGTWSNTPTLTYHWLRCSATGKSCKAIKAATDSSYKLATADTGHRIEVRVTATTQAGHANALSAPTRKVKA
jgi:hypothetical protein